MTFARTSRALALLLGAAGTAALAQGRGGGMGGGMGMPGGGRMGMPGDRMGMPMPGGMGNTPVGRGGPPPGASGSATSSMRGGLQMGPPGRWWDDKSFARTLGLNGENRDALLSRYESLQKAESKLEALARSKQPSEAALFTEIDHVAQARAELEKANTHMLLQLRDEMTADQIGKLEEHR